MLSVEKKLSLFGGTAIACSGACWMLPGINAVASVLAISGQILITSRLGSARGLWLASTGIFSAWLVCSLSMGFQAGLASTAAYILIVTAPGLMMGRACRNLVSPTRVVVWGLLPAAMLLAVFLYLYPGILENLPTYVQGFQKVAREAVGKSPALADLIARNYGSADGRLDKFLQETEAVIRFAARILPAIITLGLMVMVIAAMAITGAVSSRLKIILPRFRPYHLWRASGWWLLPTVVGLVPVVFSNDGFRFYLGVNLLIISGHAYALAGLAVVEAFFRRLMIPAPIRVILYFVMLLTSLVSLILLAALGLADSKFNFPREIEEDKID